MNTRDVAKQLVRYCRDGRHREAVTELYADHCTSREMSGVPDDFVEGKQAIVEKNNRWFDSVVEFHDSEVTDPVVAGEFFSCKMTLDVTFKDRKRMQLHELCIYKVEDGKIVSEHFYYSSPEE